MRHDFKNIQRIVVRAANWVGDAIMSTPATRALRKNFLDAEITILAKPWVGPIYNNNPYVDKIMVYEANGRHRGIRGKFQLGKDLRSEKFDLAFLLQNAFEAALISRLGRIPVRIGYNTDARSLLLTHSIPMTPAHKKRHQVDYYLGILEGASINTDGRSMDLIISESEMLNAETFLQNNRVVKGRILIGINPGAAYGNAKRWIPERFAEVCKRLSGLYKTHFIIFGAPGEAELGKQIKALIGENCINTCGKTNLREAFALIAQCRLFITNDSGLMHAAAAMHIPQIAIFGSTNHTTTYPDSPESLIVRVPTDCSPCMKPECTQKTHRCMEAVTVDMVYHVAEKIISDGYKS
ncbi:MAG: lipopolysaccharide heptosyltransferase II [Desulfobacterales bacterium]|nr:lipopolysaccharide heptosyltransferase II [Desulfobacterales bacterium]